MRCHSSKPAWVSLGGNVPLPTGNCGRAGCGKHGAGYELGMEGAAQDTSRGSAWEYGSLLLPPKSPAGRVEAPPKQWQEQLPFGSLPRHLPCQEAAGTPCAPQPPSSIPAVTKPSLPPCAFAVSPRAAPATAGAKLPPARRLPAAAVAFQEPAQERLAADKSVATDASCCFPKPQPACAPTSG